MKSFNQSNKHSAMQVAVGLLARRDHSVNELEVKLTYKGFEVVEIKNTLTKCKELGYLDDIRFAKRLFAHYIDRGHGPIRIKRSLHQKGITKSIISAIFEQIETDWFELAREKANRKYHHDAGSLLTNKERAKRIRYMLSQGFDSEQVYYALKLSNWDYGY